MVLIVLCGSVFSQCPEKAIRTPFTNRPYKIKVVSGVSSETSRVADYVEFKTMEPIYSSDGTQVFPKETAIFGVVTRRKHRSFPFMGGKIELRLEPLLTWDGQAVEIAIARKIPIGARTGQEKAEGRNEPCNGNRENCVAGRRNPSVAPAVAAAAGASGAAITAIAKDDETRFIAASAFFSLAKDLGNLLAGTDAVIAKDEVFDLYLMKNFTVCVLSLKKPDEPPK